MTSMKKEKINYFIVEIELYSTDLLVVVGDIDGAIKWLENKNVSEDDIEFIKSSCETGSQGTTGLLSNNALFIRLLHSPTTPEYKGILVHEVFHVTSILLRSRGMSLVKESEEAYAYLLEFIYRKIVEKVEELKIK